MKCNTLDSMVLGCRVFSSFTNQFDYSTTTFLVFQVAGVNSSCTNERITTVNGMCISVPIIVHRSTYNEWSVVDHFISNGIWFQNLGFQAASWASKSESLIIEWSAEIAICSTTVMSTPVLG